MEAVHGTGIREYGLSLSFSLHLYIYIYMCMYMYEENMRLTSDLAHNHYVP